MAVQREQVVQTAEKYVQRGKIEPAIREYRKLLSDNPNDINTLNRIGDLYARIQKIDEAVDFFTQIAEQYSIEGFFVKAIAIYKKIIKLDPTRLEVYEKLAELYHKQGLVNEARTQYQVLADYYQKHANAASAIAVYQKMADLEPNNPTYHVKLAEIYQQQQLTEKAVNEYRLIAEMMLAHGRSTDAAQVYERALDIDSSNVGFINDAMLKLRESGNAAAASRFLAHAVERNPQAAGLARMARVAEPEVEAEPEPAPAPPPPRAAEPAPPPRPEPPAPAPAAPAPPPPMPVAEAPRDTTFVGQLEEQSYEDYMAAAVQEAQAVMPAAPAPTQAPAPAAEETEIELDLDEVFVLDIEEDEEPTSLVKPPPDMAGGEGLRLGSAWKSGDEETPVPAAAVQEPEPEPEIEIDFSDADDFSSPLSTGGEIVLELEEDDLPRLDSAVWSMEEEPAAVEEAPREIDADFLERTAAELQPRPPERDEDLVSEAEVLAKYGLEEKALERLREALRIKPHSLPAYAAMIQIHLEAGRHERVADLAPAMARAAAEVRDVQAWPAMRRNLQEAGYRLDGDRVVAGPQGPIVEEPAPAPEPELAPPAPFSLEMMDLEAEAEPEIELEVDFEMESFQTGELLRPLPELEPEPFPEPPPAPEPVQASPEPEPAPPPSPAAAPPASRKRSKELDQMLEGLLGGKPKRPAARPAAAPPPAPEPPPPAAPVAAPVAAAPPPVAPVPTPPPAPAGPALFNPLEIGEMIEREDELDWMPADSGNGLPAQPPAAAPPDSVASVFPGLDDTGGGWLDEAERHRPAQAGSDSLFDEEDDFFDLAAELEQELSQEGIFHGGDTMQQAEQSLEEIVEGFKKGVAEHLSPTDYDTHFNLGIAYREMGLLDEAIGEFQVAAKDSGHLVLCCSMLGLCFLDKGLPELAIKWYRRGLEAPAINEEDTLGLLYDLGCAYLAIDDQASAYKAFVDLYGINTNYRDVVARIEELGRDR
ncbi:MAG TPA: tetratricopeptide repeat protein [Thermoanaerobaculia bacterium]